MRVYIGHDWREKEAYEVCKYSLERHSSIPLEIEPLNASHPYYNREFYWKGNQRFDRVDNLPFSTDFSFARFLVPIIQGYRGVALFVDCDFLFRADVKELFDMADDEHAVHVVQHDYFPSSMEKMDHMEQTRYPRKNWSSLVLWNCGHRAHGRHGTWVGVDGEKVNTYPGIWLHSFQWLEMNEIGTLGPEWNHLVGWSKAENPKAVHFTEGGPWLEKYRRVEYADEWLAERDLMMAEK